ncbi:MAG: signal peptidase I [Myxococcota bacterium]
MLTRVFVLAMLLGVGSIVAKLYVFDFVRVQGNEMAPAVVAGDLVLVSRLFSQVERGDVVMLRHPRQPERFLIRRVVALPGETIAVKEGAVILDGEPARRERAGEMVLRHIGKDGRPLGDAVYTLEIEHLGERAVRTLRSPKARAAGAAKQRLAEGYFVLADNRSEAFDSRDFGPVLPSFVRGAVWAILDAGADAGPALDPAQRRWTRVR